MIPVITSTTTRKSTRRVRLSAYTLVELLIVLSIMVLLAAVALPTVKDLLANQQIAKTARNISAFIDKARSRAVAEERYIGIRLERLNSIEPNYTPGDAPPVGRAHSIRIRELTSVPPYTGDASNAFAELKTDTRYANTNLSYVTFAEFNPSDNALLALSASMVDPNTSLQITNPMQPGYVLAPKSEPNDDVSAPIRSGDYIELPAGRLVPFKIQHRPLNAGATIPVRLLFDLSEMRTAGTKSFPSGNPIFPTSILENNGLVHEGVLVNETANDVTLRRLDGSDITISRSDITRMWGRKIKYKIHRRPVVSTAAPYSLPRGVVVDLNYSGTGMEGNEFAPSPLTADIQGGFNAKPIDIIFGPDGSVVSITTAFNDVPSFPQGQIFLCLGDSDGVRTDNLVTPEKKAPANLVNLESKWLVITPATGRVVSSPFSSVSVLSSNKVVDPYDASLDPAIAQARLLANFSDTVDIE